MPTVAPTNSQPTASWPSALDSTSCPTAQLSAASALLAILVQTQATSQGSARTDIEWNAQRLDELKQQLADSIRKAEEAANHSGFLGFLGDIFGGDIAQIAGALAAVAAMVATGGAASALIMIAIAEGLQLGAKAGAELGLDPKLCMALSLASVAVGLCTGTGELQGASMLAQGARDVELGAKILQGSSTITGGALHYAAADYHATSLHYHADAVGVRAKEDTTNLDFSDALSMLQRALRTAQRETSTVSQMVQDDRDSDIALSDRI